MPRARLKSPRCDEVAYNALMKYSLRTVTARPKRRWYQLSLLAILILMGIGPILLTFLYFEIVAQNAAPKQDEGFMTLEEIFKEAENRP